MDQMWLVDFSAAVIAFAILMYVILHGYDLGVGILFGTQTNEQHRATMIGAIAPYWDGNETWLILVGAGLFAAFPMVYAIFLPAFCHKRKGDRKLRSRNSKATPRKAIPNSINATGR
jgi:cytochrome bd-type quinol oxidase subunit 2